jgi:hypothetical protein
MKKISVLIIFLSLAFQYANCQDPKFEAIFIYNFTKYLKWPENGIGNEFVISVLGTSKVTDELKVIASSKTVAGKKLIIKTISSSEVSADCQILFLTKGNSNLIKKISESFANSPILIVTENPNSCLNGACINFIMKNTNLSFEISKGNLSKKNISVSSELLSLATVIN